MNQYFRWFPHFMVWGTLISLGHIIGLLAIFANGQPIPPALLSVGPVAIYQGGIPFPFLTRILDPLTGLLFAISMTILNTKSKEYPSEPIGELSGIGLVVGLIMGLIAWPFGIFILAVFAGLSALLLGMVMVMDILKFRDKKEWNLGEMAYGGLHVAIGIGIVGGFVVGFCAIVIEVGLVGLVFGIRKAMTSALLATYPVNGHA